MASGRSVGRLARAEEFRLVYREGTRHSSRFLVIHVRPTALPTVRLGLAVGRRVGSAVARNRMRRRLREAVVAHRQGIERGVDLVVVARPEAAAATFAELRADLATALRSAALLGSAGGTP